MYSFAPVAGGIGMSRQSLLGVIVFCLAFALVSKGGVQYTQGALPEGENGILLFIRQNGKVFRQRMVVNIKPNRYQRLRLRITP